MSGDLPTTEEVRDLLERNLHSYEQETSDIAGGLSVLVPDEEVGRFYRAFRTSGLMDSVQAKRFGDNLVAHIEAEESGTLADLFR